VSQKTTPDEDLEATVGIIAARRKVFQRSVLQTDAMVRTAESHSLPLGGLTGINPIVAAANPLLSLVPQLRSSMAHPDPTGLRELLLRQISAFEKASRDHGVSPEHVHVARYALCTLIDESISLTPWGSSAHWANSSLLVTLYKETWGGEKFFLLLGKLAEDPIKNRYPLELMYVCLALGFEGRYRVIDRGRAQLDEVRERLYNMLRNQRRDGERDLSPHWRGLKTTIGRAVRFLPLWVTASLAVVLLAGLFIGLSIALNRSSDRVFGTLAKLRVPAPPQPVATVIPKVVVARLSGFLTDEIAKGLVEVKEDETTSRVTIRGDNLFERGSAVIELQYEPILARIADALNNVPGLVTVTGHTDSDPLRYSARFPSNWHLSQERAVSVVRLMSRTVKDPSRMKAEGAADAYPVAPNDTKENKARNRRVEIVLKVAQQ